MDKSRNNLEYNSKETLEQQISRRRKEKYHCEMHMCDFDHRELCQSKELDNVEREVPKYR